MKAQFTDNDVLIGEVTEEDKKLFFADNNGVCPIPFIQMGNNTTFPDVLVKCGIFVSKSDAKRNGWNKENNKLDIPVGFTDLTVGKLKSRITILKV